MEQARKEAVAVDVDEWEDRLEQDLVDNVCVRVVATRFLTQQVNPATVSLVQSAELQ